MTAITPSNVTNSISTALQGASGSTTSSANSSIANLGINDFITLMTTQMQNQDPTQPQDPSQMVAQLAQFSTVSGVQQLDSSMTSLTSQLLGSQAVTSASLVGHSVLVPASNAAINSGTSVAGSIAAPTGASSVNLVITDASGQPVTQMTLPVNSGTANFNWNGTDSNGNAVPTGKYTFNATGSVAGQNSVGTVSLASLVDSVTINPANNTVQLNTDTVGSVPLSSVQQIF